jgi:hypothetical protein
MLVAPVSLGARSGPPSIEKLPRPRPRPTLAASPSPSASSTLGTVAPALPLVWYSSPDGALAVSGSAAPDVSAPEVSASTLGPLVKVSSPSSMPSAAVRVLHEELRAGAGRGRGRFGRVSLRAAHGRCGRREGARRCGGGRRPPRRRPLGPRPAPAAAARRSQPARGQRRAGGRARGAGGARRCRLCERLVAERRRRARRGRARAACAQAERPRAPVALRGARRGAPAAAAANLGRGA